MGETINFDKKHALQLRDTLTLSEAFYTAFDSTKVMRTIQDFLENRLDRLSYVGGGSHMDVWRFSVKHDLSYVLKISRDDLSVDLFRGLRAFKEARLTDLPLLPPFELIDFEGSFFFISLYGERPDHEMLPHWHPLAEVITGTQEQLKKNGFFINDFIQIRLFKGIPFICDLSDLSLIPPK